MCMYIYIMHMQMFQPEPEIQSPTKEGQTLKYALSSLTHHSDLMWMGSEDKDGIMRMG